MWAFEKEKRKAIERGNVGTIIRAIIYTIPSSICTRMSAWKKILHQTHWKLFTQIEPKENSIALPGQKKERQRKGANSRVREWWRETMLRATEENPVLKLTRGCCYCMPVSMSPQQQQHARKIRSVLFSSSVRFLVNFAIFYSDVYVPVPGHILPN